MSNASRFLHRKYRGLPFDKKAFDKHIATLALKLDVYDKILSEQKYIAGNVCVLINYVKMNMNLCVHFSFMLGHHTSRPLSCPFGICGFAIGK